ncbi:DUF3419 family protein [Flexithrix dorotheae]|uniref:DUF3419 family protein n=1 Tax=Flexithrix dorotheae TaxID=70993 RepID=UPI0003770097|nr:BtaA family protein [Flexithrix dorotheae]
MGIQLQKTINGLKDNIFKEIHSKNLVYNACWEDPRVDRELLNFNQESKIVMITSAGCNVLDYLLDNPKSIDTIDVNPKQNALLALKIALFEHGRFDYLFAMFGKGHFKESKKLYEDNLRSLIPEYAQQFWDKKLKYFYDSRIRKSFYFNGTSGSFAWWMNNFFDSNKSLRKLTYDLVHAKSIDEQEKVYNQIEPKLFNNFIKWVLGRQLTMSMLGVPRPQKQLILDQFPGGVPSYISSSLRHVFTKLPIYENYFWHAYITGSYSKSCCPEYLNFENFQELREKTSRLKLHNNTISGFLKENPGNYSHYILLDHQDWLASHDPEALNEEWELILKNSTPGTQILMRSAALEIDFLPDFVKEAVSFKTTKDLMDFHKRDRVGTYGSVYLGTVK